MGDLKKTPVTGGGDTAIDIPDVRKVLRKVAAEVRQGKKQIYEPVLVSLGPYHHNERKSGQVEALKYEILKEKDYSNSAEKLLVEVRSRIGEIRSFYGDLSADEFYKDDQLAEMMVRDACFLLYCMKTKIVAPDHGDNSIIYRKLGMSRVAFLIRDFFMLENQLPFWILENLISFTFQGKPVSQPSDQHDHGSNGVEGFFCQLLNPKADSTASCKLPRVHSKIKQQTLHLLDDCRATLVHDENINTKKPTCFSIFRPRNKSKKNSQFRSAKDLKSKGIHFRPSSNSLRDISFTSHSFYGMLRLPVLTLDNNTNVILSNIIALEMSPCSGTDFAVISYVKFMKSLIVKAEDVKELREKEIILSCMADDEEVVKMFKEFNTDGSCNKDIHRDVRDAINDHCRSKAKTFKAELIHTYFRTPWTAIALFAASLLLVINCLNFLINYYRMVTYPVKQK